MDKVMFQRKCWWRDRDSQIKNLAGDQRLLIKFTCRHVPSALSLPSRCLSLLSFFCFTFRRRSPTVQTIHFIHCLSALYEMIHSNQRLVACQDERWNEMTGRTETDEEQTNRKIKKNENEILYIGAYRIRSDLDISCILSHSTRLHFSHVYASNVQWRSMALIGNFSFSFNVCVVGDHKQALAAIDSAVQS